jgi:hypothetical protein
MNAQVIKLAVLYACQERHDLGACVDKRRTRGMPGVAHSDAASGQLGDLDTAPRGVAGQALAPVRHRQLIGRDSVLDLHLLSALPGKKGNHYGPPHRTRRAGRARCSLTEQMHVQKTVQKFVHLFYAKVCAGDGCR